MATKKIYMQRTCVQDNKVTDIFVEEVSRDEFDKYKSELQGGHGGCCRVDVVGRSSFVAHFKILGEPETELCQVVGLSRVFLRELLVGLHAPLLFSFKQNKRRRMPDRSVEISTSPWDKPESRNFLAVGVVNGNRVWASNGVTIDSAIATIMAASVGD